jgi:hypothetical protein
MRKRIFTAGVDPRIARKTVVETQANRVHRDENCAD